MKTEPVYLNTAIMAVLSAALSLLVAFGFDLSPDQVAAILGFANPLIMLIGAIATRSIVFAPATVDEQFYAPGHPADGPEIA